MSNFRTDKCNHGVPLDQPCLECKADRSRQVTIEATVAAEQLAAECAGLRELNRQLYAENADLRQRLQRLVDVG